MSETPGARKRTQPASFVIGVIVGGLLGFVLWVIVWANLESSTGRDWTMPMIGLGAVGITGLMGLGGLVGKRISHK